MKLPHHTFRPILILCLVLFTAWGAYAQPSWVSGYPQLLSGATSVDLKVQIDSAGTIYWAIYNSAQTGITSAQLKNDALYGGNLGLVRRGNVAVPSNTLQFIKQATLTNNTTYHIYLVAESNGGLMSTNKVSYTSRFFPKRQQEFYNFSNNSMNSYLMYFPEDYYKTTTKYPLLLFLGGLGEMTKGGPANPSLLLLTGLPEVINLGKEVPMIVASPQGINTWVGSHVDVDAYIEFLKVTYRVDASQIFLTGLSDGGEGDFDYANNYPSKVKALVPTSTWPYNADIHNFLRLPVWAFMGDQDDHNFLISWINQLKAIGGNATYTEYPGAHTKAVWNAAFDGSRGDDIYSWMLNGSSQAPPPPNLPPVVNAGYDQSVGLPLPQFQITGTASDPDGTIASYSWSQISGSNVTMTTANTPTLTLTNINPGQYIFQLTVQDNRGATAYDQLIVFVAADGAVTREYDVNITWPYNLQGGTIWNDFVTTGGGIVGNSKTLFDINHLSSPVTISITAPFVDGNNNHGVTPGIYPNNVVQYFLRSTNTSVGALKLSGLSLSKVYDLSILSSNSDSWYPNDTRFTVNGQSVVINATWNVNQLASFASIVPNASGEIAITVAPATTNSANNGIINALILQEKAPSTPNIPPVVNAGPDQQITLPISQLQLPGTATDPDGIISSLLWTKVSGPNVTMVNATTSSLTLTSISAGTYVFQLSAQDNRNAATADQVTVTVNPGTIVPPVVDAGADKSVTLPVTQFQLTGTASDSDGFIYSWMWTKFSGPAVVMTNITTPTVTLTSLVTGTYVFQLSVQDNAGAMVSDQVTVTVNGNVAPVVNAGPDQTVGLPLSQVQLTGTASDSDGTIASYLWTEVSGPPVTMANANTSILTLTNLTLGTYVFQLAVQDNGGAAASDQVTLTVNSSAVGREFDVNITWPYNLQGGTVWNDFATTGGGVVGNSKVLYDINHVLSPITISITAPFQDGNNNHGVMPGIYPNQVMWYYLRSTTTKVGALKLSGLNLSNVYDLSILSSNADVWYPSDTRLTVNGQSVTINAKGNANQLANFIAVAPNASGEINITIAPATTDATNNGVINALILKERSLVTNTPPVVNAGTDQQVTLPLSQLILNGTATDPDGTIASMLWTKVSGPGITLANTTTASLTLTNIAAGTYVFQLSAQDNSNATTTDQVIVTVNPGIIVPPVVNAGLDKSLKPPVPQLQLTGTATDSDGFIYSMLWTEVAGPVATMSNATSPTLTLTNLGVGAYIFQFSATDNSGGTSTDQVSVTVTPNMPPLVNAGPDQQVTLPLTQLQLPGTATDTDGTITSLLWTKVSGPNITLANTTAATLLLTNIAAGTYVFQLSAQDDNLATTSDQITVTVNPGIIVPPVVYAGADQIVKLPVPQLQLTGTATDSDGFIYSLLWTQVSGPAVTMSNTTTLALTLTNLVIGTYVFQLSAQDNSGGAGTDQVAVTVYNNLPPLVDAGPDQQVTLPLSQLALSGTATDPDGAIASMQWTKVSGPNITMTNTTTSTLTLTNIAAGTYVFQFSAQDNGAVTSTDQVTVTVNPGIIIPPVVNAGADNTVTLPLAQLLLTGTATDSDGFIYSLLWTKVSGPAVTMTNIATATVSLTNLVAGTYVFQLSAQDNSGATVTDQVTVTVNNNVPPLVNAGPDQTLTLPLSQVLLTGTATDSDGTIASLLWTKVSGPAATLAGTTTLTLTLTNLLAGTYVFQLSAQDNGGATTNDQLTLVINPAPITGTREFDINLTWAWNVQASLPWNDFITSNGTGTSSPLFDKNGITSTIIISTTAQFFVDGASNHGVVPGLYPKNVMTFYLRSTQTMQGALKLAGLSTAKQYDISIMCSNYDFWYPSNTRLTVQGQVVTFNATSNANQLVNFTNIAPTALGQIPIAVAPATTVSNNVGVINAIVLTEHDPISGARTMTQDVAAADRDKPSAPMGNFVNVSPNPVDDYVNVEINSTLLQHETYSIEFTDIRGIPVHSRQIEGQGTNYVVERIPADFMQTGLYIMSIRSRQNGVAYFKVLKK